MVKKQNSRKTECKYGPLKTWVGVPVTVDTESGLIYHGKISKYDPDFITLNPAQIHDTYYWDTSYSCAREMLQKYEAGKSKLEVILGRRDIKRIMYFKR